MDPGLRRDDDLAQPSSRRRPGSIWNLAMDRQPCVYILASGKRGTLYTGVTSNLTKRVWQHKNRIVEGFTDRYNLHALVWFELHNTMESAILREKAIKNWKRDWKIRLIEEENLHWTDLYCALM
jgi:putative endonuclease